jgi:hypothetical protein
VILAKDDLRHPYLGKHVRSLTFLHQVEHHESAKVSVASKEGLRQDTWDMAVGLIELCPHLEVLEWALGVGVNSALWKVSKQISGGFSPTEICPNHRRCQSFLR